MQAAVSGRSSGRRRRIPGDQRRETILVAASRVFAKRGYDGTRTLELAENAGVSEALMYQHFRTKADLYRAALTRSSGLLDQRLKEAANSEVPADQRVESSLNALLEFVAEPDNAWPVLTLHVADPELAEHQRKLRGRAVAVLAGLLANDPEVGRQSISPRRLEQVAEMIAGAAESLAGWSQEHPRAKRDELVALLAAFVRGGFERTLEL
jgi:AcrR family transcriptional regulator